MGLRSHVVVGDRTIGPEKPVFIIAEVGVNHNGDIGLAKSLIDCALDAGADAVKFQTFKTEKLVTKTGKQAKYQTENVGKEESQFEMLKRLELNEKDFAELRDYCTMKGIIFLSTPFDKESAVLLKNLNITAFKVSSSDLTNLPFLRFLGDFHKPIILSSGMATNDEIDDGLRTVLSTGNEDIVLLHCVTNYPTRPEQLNLRVIDALIHKYGMPVGFSDHSMGIYAAVAAVALGAVVVEKHITLDRSSPGPDHHTSLEPPEFRQLVDAIRSTELALGSSDKLVGYDERENRDVARKSLVAAVAIHKGSIISEDMLEIKRPGTGISPRFFNDVIGKKAKGDIEQDTIISWTDLE